MATHELKSKRSARSNSYTAIIYFMNDMLISIYYTYHLKSCNVIQNVADVKGKNKKSTWQDLFWRT